MTAPKDVTVPIPANDTKAERDQVRHSNDRDQQLERDGKTSRHNEGYDDATNARVPAVTPVEREA